MLFVSVTPWSLFCLLKTVSKIKDAVALSPVDTNFAIVFIVFSFEYVIIPEKISLLKLARLSSVSNSVVSAPTVLAKSFAAFFSAFLACLAAFFSAFLTCLAAFFSAFLTCLAATLSSLDKFIFSPVLLTLTSELSSPVAVSS